MKNILVLLKFLLIGNLAFSQTVGNLESLDGKYVILHQKQAQRLT